VSTKDTLTIVPVDGEGTGLLPVGRHPGVGKTRWAGEHV
jgi:hypothetical protein